MASLFGVNDRTDAPDRCVEGYVIKVYSATDLVDAHIIKGLLENHGIPARVDGGYLSGGIGELPPMGLVTVSVSEERLDEARKVLDEFWRDGE